MEIIVIVTYSQNEFPEKLSTFFTFIGFMELFALYGCYVLLWNVKDRCLEKKLVLIL